MGNHLAAPPAVNIADISSSLQLLGPLGGEGRNFLSSLHCIERADVQPPHSVVSTDGEGIGSAQSRMRLHAARRQRRRRQLHHCGRGSPNPSGSLFEAEELGPDLLVSSAAADFSFQGILLAHANHYQQLLAAVDGAGCNQPKYSTALTTGPSSASWSTAGSTEEEALAHGEVWVIKVFVKTAGDAAQLSLLAEVNGMMQGLQEHMRAVDATLAAHTPGNILSYNTVSAKREDRYCLLQRQHIALSLLERMASRPTWSSVDRLFACYQLLQALVQLHEVYRMVHGDIKSSNVLLHSTGWLYLTDVAPFKPARLPANNPALFDFYYDTDDSKVCCLAPEKFEAISEQSPSPAQLTATGAGTPVPTTTAIANGDCARYRIENLNIHGHTPSMDLFSAACVMSHILSDEPLFHLSELLELRLLPTEDAKRRWVCQVLQDHNTPEFAIPMLLSILCVASQDRPSARQVLETFTPSVFPKWHATFHSAVLPIVLACPIPAQAHLLYASMDSILKECSGGEDTTTPLVVQLLLPALLQAIRTAGTDEGTYRGVACLHRVLQAAGGEPLEPQVELVLPHLLIVVNSAAAYGATTRVLALRTVCDIAERVVRRLSRAPLRPSSLAGEAATAPPSLSAPLCTMLLEALALPCLGDVIAQTEWEDIAVLTEVAGQLPRLLLLTRHCLERRPPPFFPRLTEGLVRSTQGPSYGQQLQTLLSNGWSMLQVLYRSDAVPVVTTLLQQTLYVVAFLGEARVQEDLLPLFTTTAASPSAVQRVLFPQAVLLHAALQQPHIQTAQFFVEEGLQSSDVVTVNGTLRSLAILVRAKRLPTSDAMSLVYQALPLTGSDVVPVRRAACQVVEVAASVYPTSVVLPYLAWAVQPFLTHGIPLSSLSLFPAALRGGGVEPDGTTVRHEGFPRTEANGCEEPRLTLVLPTSLRVYTAPPTLDPVLSQLRGVMEDGSEEASAAGAPVWLHCRTPREEQRQDRNFHAPRPPSTTEARVWDVNDRLRVDPPPQPSIMAPSTTSADAKPLRSLAVPADAHSAHLGAIHVLHCLPHGRLLSAGARGEGKIWQLTPGTTQLTTATHLPMTISSMESYTSGCALRDNTVLNSSASCSAVVLGATDGSLIQWDTASNKIVAQYLAQRDSILGSGAAAIRATVQQGDNVVLCCSASGDVELVDFRVPITSVWHLRVAPRDGAPSCLVPLRTGLQQQQTVHAVLVGTYDGVAQLFDLRFQLGVSRYEVPRRQPSPSPAVTAAMATSINQPRRHSILCASIDPSPRGVFAPREGSDGPAVLLGTDVGIVYRLQLLDSESREVRPYLVPAPPLHGCGGSHRELPSALRCLLPRSTHHEVLSGSEAGVIRQWSLRHPAASHTLCCPPTMCSNSYEGVCSTTGGSDCWTIREVPPTLPRQEIAHHSDAVLSLTTMDLGVADALHLVSGARDGTLTLWASA